MSGIFPSTGAATFLIRYPIRTATTGSSANLAYTSSYGLANSAFTCVISRPTGADLSFTMDSPPAGITWDFVGTSPAASFRINMAASLFTTAGMYHCALKVTADASYLGEVAGVQWGGWVDTASTGAADSATAAAQATIAATQSTTAATQSTTAATQATTAATQATTAASQSTAAASSAATAATEAETARKLLSNRVEVNSATNPTALTIYDDDGTTPLFTRTIGNGDGSAVSPVQVLRLGACV